MIDIEKPFEDEKRTTEGRLDREVRKSVSNCRKKQVRVSRRPVVLIVGICSELVNTKKKKKLRVKECSAMLNAKSDAKVLFSMRLVFVGYLGRKI